MTHTPTTPETKQVNHPISIDALETFDAPTTAPFVERFEIPEFTSLCPKTGQPDFANIVIWYAPDKKCVELKALKMWMWSFRDVGAYHEKLTADICADLAKKLEPKWMLVEGNFWVRGGVHTVVFASHGAVPESLTTARLNKTDYRGY